MITLGLSEIRTDEVTTLSPALAAVVSAGSSVSTWASAAVETAVRTWSNALSTATVSPAGVVGARFLSEAGRDLARHGEAVYLLDVDPSGRQRFLRATISEVYGSGPDSSDWLYRLNVHGPQTTTTLTAPAARVVHVRYATEPYRPEKGLSPLGYANLTGALSSNLERALGDEAGGAVAKIITLPEGHDQTNSQALASSLANARGRTILTETTKGGYADRDTAPRRDWQPERLGAEIPQALVALRGQIETSILACYGIPAPLSGIGVTDGTAQREGLRRLWTLAIQPLADLIAEELSRVLERKVELSHASAAGTTDIAARARSVHVLTQSGLPLEAAMSIVGWGDVEIPERPQPQEPREPEPPTNE